MFTSMSHLDNYRRAREMLKDPAMRTREFWVHDWRGRLKMDATEDDPTGYAIYADPLVGALTDDRMDDSVNSLPYLVKLCPCPKPDDYGRGEEDCRTNSRYSKVALYGDDAAREAIDAEIERKIKRLTKEAKDEQKLAVKWRAEVEKEFPKYPDTVILFRTLDLPEKEGSKKTVNALELVLLRPERIRIRGFGCFLEQIKKGEVVITPKAEAWLKPVKAKGGMMGLEFFDTDKGVIVAGMFSGMYSYFVQDSVSVNGKALAKLKALS